MLPMESQPRLLNLSPREVQKAYLLDMSPTPPKRIAIYARVSTFDKGQDPETQRPPAAQFNRIVSGMLVKLVQVRDGLLIFQHAGHNPLR